MWAIKTPKQESDTMQTIYEGHGITVKTKNCEHFQIDDTTAETIEIFTGPHAYETTLEKLYELNKQQAYYETQNHWGQICSSSFEHACGL